jgi:small membrane protein
MIAQLILSLLLAGILLYAWTEYRRSPAVAVLALLAASAGLYFVWMPEHSTQLAEWVGIGRGVDLILYIWVCISLIVLLNLHLKLRTQTELITALARKIAIADARPEPLPEEDRATSVRSLHAPAESGGVRAAGAAPTQIGLVRATLD